MKKNDSIQRFIFENKDVRGEIAHLDSTLTKVFQEHEYPACVEHLLAEVILSALMISSTLKFEGQMTLQFKSEKPLSLLLVKCTEDLQIRALAQFDESASEEELLGSLEGGLLIVTLQADSLAKPYQSMVPLHGSISQSLEYYFVQSEQLPSRFWFSIKDGKASGMLLQQLPQQGSSEERDIFWEHASKLAETLTEDELLTLDNQTLLHRLYHEDDIRLFDSKDVDFHCPCSRSRMLEAVKTLGKEEATVHFKTNKSINVTCEFCLQHYAFDKVDVDYLFQTQ